MATSLSARTSTGAKPECAQSIRYLAAATLLVLATIASLSPSSAQDFAIAPQYEAVGHFHEGVAPARLDGKWGLIDREGNWRVTPTYESVYRGGDGRIGIKQNGLWGFISTSGEVVIAPRYVEVRGFSGGVARVRESDAGWFYIDPFGNRESDETYLDATDRSEGFSVVKYEDQYNGEVWAILDPRGAKQVMWSVTGKEANRAGTFSDGFVGMRTDKGTIYVSATGLTLFDSNPIQNGRSFSEGLAAGSDGKKWGFFNTKGETVIPLRFDAARDFTYGVAPAAAGKRWGYIDRDGNTAFEPTFDAAYSFREGYATVKLNDRFGFLKIDDNARISVHIEPVFEDVYSFREGFAPVMQGGKWGFIAAPDASFASVRGIAELAPN